MNYQFSVVLLFAITSSIFGQNRDSLISVAAHGTNEDKIESLIKLTRIETEKDTQKANYYAQKALNIANKLKDNELLAESFYNMALMHQANQNTDSAKHFFNLAIKRWPNGYKTNEKTDLISNFYLEYQNQEKNDSAILLIDGFLKTEENLSVKNKIDLLKLSSRSWYLLSRYETAIKQMEEIIALQTSIADSVGMVDILNKMSTTYRKLGNYEKAVENSQNALKLNEKLKNLVGEAESFSTLGGIYYYMNNNDQAIAYFKQALEIFEKLNIPARIAAINNNIGSVYNEMGQLQNALLYYQKAHEQYAAQKSDYPLAIITDNIGLVYSGLGQNDKALIQFLEALRLFEKVGNRDGYTHCLVNLAGLYRKNSANELALETYKKALNLSEELDLGNEKLQIYREMSQLFEDLGRYKESLQYFKLYQQTSDTLQSEASLEQLNEMRSKLELKDRENKISLLSKENELSASMVQKQRIVLFSVILISLMVAILLFIVSRALQFSRRAKVKLEEQNKKISLQSNEIQFKNKQLTDSIHYANRVQEAIFVPLPGLKDHVADFFIISKPQNIVSGDFYWYRPVNNYLYIALADCTGHGVPGALMSMLGNTLLNEVFVNGQILETNEVLNQLRLKIKTSLHQTDLQGNTDGLDIALCRINFNNLEMQFSGALQPAYLIDKQQVTELKPDKMPVAVNRNESTFNQQRYILRKGTRLVFSSDGFYDQFGGADNSKITKNRFKQLLAESAEKYLPDMGESLIQFFNAWKGSTEQTDDVMVLGIEI